MNVKHRAMKLPRIRCTCNLRMRRWAPILAVLSFAVGVCSAQQNLPVNSTNDHREQVRVRLLPLRLVPFTNGLFLDVHRTAKQMTFSSLTRRETQFGGAIAAAGEVNGDGFGDVLISAFRHQSGQLLRAGAATLLTGSSTGLNANSSWSFFGKQANRQLGHALAGGWDVNGDGLMDMAASVVHRLSSAENRGGLNLFYGSKNRNSDWRDWQYVPEERDSQLGDSLAMADFNGDRFADLIAGAARHTESFSKEGASFLFFGGEQGLATTPSWSAFGGATDSGFGDCLISPGDVNGDGFPDVLIGAPAYPVHGKPTGRVFLFTGGPSGLSQTPTWTADGISANSQFGQSISGVGDVNGDGCSDFVVGAPQRSTTDPLPGTAFLFLGARANMSTNAVWAVSGEAPGARFGAAVAGVGDVNGDGFNDVLIGSPDLTVPDGGAKIGGRAYLYLGLKGGVESAPSWMVEGANAFRAGTVLAALGDLDRDGFNDFALGLPQRARVDVFYGASNGYHRGDVFPSDNISSRKVSPVPPSSSLGPTQDQKIWDSIFRLRFWIFGLCLVAAAIAFRIWQRMQRRKVSEAKNDLEQARDQERHRIARDLHDDLGARIARISLLTELVRRQSGQTDEGRQQAKLLSETAQEVLTSMEEILWSVNPGNDTLENLVTFITQYAGTFFAPTGIACRYEAPVNLPDLKIEASIRKNIFLTVKEALNNVAKHSSATEAHVNITFTASLLSVTIEENGRGWGTDADPRASTQSPPVQPLPRHGHSLNNMHARMEKIQGRFVIEERSKGGTCVRLEVNL